MRSNFSKEDVLGNELEHQHNKPKQSYFVFEENLTPLTLNSKTEFEMLRSKLLFHYGFLKQKLGCKNFTLSKTVICLTTTALILLIVLLHAFMKRENASVLFNEHTNSGNNKRIGLDDIFKDTFQLNYESFKFIRPPPESMARSVVDPGLFYTVAETPNHKIRIFASTLFDPDMHIDLGSDSFMHSDSKFQTDSFEVSYDLESAIIGTNRTVQYRHSKRALYWFRNTLTGEHTPIGDGEFLINCKYSAGYRYIYFTDLNYDFFIQPINPQSHELGNAMRVTSDGVKNLILNGVCDWVYQEEVLATDNTVWFSLDDSKALFMKQFDDRVETFHLSNFITNSYEKIQELVSLKYPRPGGNLPKYEIQMVDLTTGVVLPITNYKPDQEIMYAVDWVTTKSFVIRTSDRYSTKLTFTLYTLNTTSNTWVHSKIRSVPFKDMFNGYVEKQKPLTIVKKYDREGDSSKNTNLNMILSSTGFAYLAPDESGFQHIHLTESLKSPNTFIPITKGDFEVLEIVGVDNENNDVYFMSNSASTFAKHLSVVNLNTFSVKQLQLCDSELRDYCQFDYNEIELSMTTRWAYRKLLGPGEPELYAGKLEDVVPGIVDVDSKTIDPEETFISEDMYILKLSDTESLKQKVQEFAMPTINFKTMTLDDGIVIDYKEYLPPGYDERDNSIMYPLLTHVYGAPGSMTFNSKFSVFFESAVASGLNSIVLEIEPRGTGGKGWSFKQWATRNIGYWEPKDFQQVVKKYIAEKEDKIIKEKVAIWGWSYGGFITLKTLEYDKGETFKYGMAVAPVTDWKMYDAIYAERYMGDPFDDSDQNGYKDAKISNISAFKDITRFLVMAGTGDDNVHISNTYRLLDEFNLNEVTNFDMMVFPDSDHKIAFHNANKIVYRKLYTWLENAFNGIYESMIY